MLGRIRDMMSPAMRIREVSANGSPYHWYLENAINGSWQSESECSLIFWNWFGKRTERYYINTLLPARGAPIMHNQDQKTTNQDEQANAVKNSTLQTDSP